MPDTTESTEESTVETSEETATPGGEKTKVVAGAVAQHEFNANDRTNSHRLVATAMIVTFVIVAVKQDWWKHLRNFIATKTHGPAEQSKQGG